MRDLDAGTDQHLLGGKLVTHRDQAAKEQVIGAQSCQK
jgi:hypothetical protein